MPATLLKHTLSTSDEYCPHCDNHFVLDAKTPQVQLQVEGEDVRKDARSARNPPSEPTLTLPGCSRTSVSVSKRSGRYSTSRTPPTGWVKKKKKKGNYHSIPHEPTTCVKHLVFDTPPVPCPMSTDRSLIRMSWSGTVGMRHKVYGAGYMLHVARHRITTGKADEVHVLDMPFEALAGRSCRIPSGKSTRRQCYSCANLFSLHPLSARYPSMLPIP